VVSVYPLNYLPARILDLLGAITVGGDATATPMVIGAQPGIREFRLGYADTI
jgi:hypothetical protein